VNDILTFLQSQALLVAALAILLAAFYRKETRAGGDKLSLNQVIMALNADKAVLVDLRESKDFSQGHVANAINIPHNKLNDNIKTLDKHKEQQVIVTDTMGQHAGAACLALKKAGFNVARMRGGMAEWKQEGLPLVK
jgi:rhodanese-related sulfurtransferase